MSLRISEIFLGFEGEGLEIGVPKVFVRTQKCSVGCKVCDTPQALSSNGGTEMNVEDIVDKVKLLSWDGRTIDHVTITGGSPLECNRRELIYLLELLKLDDYWITLEESGQAYSKDVFEVCDSLSIDAKSPSTGVKFNRKVHNLLFNNFRHKVQIKIIVKDEKDLEFVEDYVDAPFGFKNVVVTPCWEIGETFRTFRKRVKWIHKEIFKRNLAVRVIPQIHKIIYGTRRIGV